MKKELSLAITCLLFLAACGNQHDGKISNQNLATPASTTTPEVGPDQNYGDEATGIITIFNATDGPYKCKIKAEPDIIYLRSDQNPKAIKVNWIVVNNCTDASASDLNVQIELKDGKYPFGNKDHCDNSFFVDKVEKNKKSRVVSRAATGAPGTYYYGVKVPGAANDLDPQIQIGFR